MNQNNQLLYEACVYCSHIVLNESVLNSSARLKALSDEEIIAEWHAHCGDDDCLMMFAKAILKKANGQ
jgi:metal-responsive CopG/Arc/MetJ family transcriptional regulator